MSISFWISNTKSYFSQFFRSVNFYFKRLYFHCILSVLDCTLILILCVEKYILHWTTNHQFLLLIISWFLDFSESFILSSEYTLTMQFLVLQIHWSIARIFINLNYFKFKSFLQNLLSESTESIPRREDSNNHVPAAGDRQNQPSSWRYLGPIAVVVGLTVLLQESTSFWKLLLVHSLKYLP